MRRTARILVTNGIETMTDIMATSNRHRGYLVEDMRKNGYSYMHIRLAMQLFGVDASADRNL